MPVDISEVLALEAYAIREIDRTYDHLIKVTEQAAAKEKRGHPYQNQTGNMERATVATVDGATSDGGECRLVIGVEYASYVVEKGFSLIEQEAERAARRHQEYLGKVAEDITSR